MPSARELFDELLACEAEFGPVSFDQRGGIIGVDTSTIRLEEVDLGPFGLRLCISDVPTGSPEYWVRCEALEPYTATSNDSVTHPLVNTETLCLGEATTAVCAALLDGRIGDAFVLMRSTLQTYNPDSAYVSLEDWEGVPCSECSVQLHPDDAVYVDGCECRLCDQCSLMCLYSDAIGCRSCFTKLETTGEWVHPDEATTCERCSRSCATGELRPHFISP